MKLTVSRTACKLFSVTLPVIALSFSVGCQTPNKMSTEDARYYPPGPQARQVATVAYLNEPAGFVLLEVSPGFDAAPGSEVVTLQNGKVQSTLKISDHRRPPHVVADIMDTTPPVGARVFELP